MMVERVAMAQRELKQAHDKIEGIVRSLDAGASVWLDRQNETAGPLDRQIIEGIRINDTVVMVLSKSALESYWVEFELTAARHKQEAELFDEMKQV